MSEWVFVLAGALLTLAAVMALFRIVRGPTILDRMIASDMLLTVIICAIGAEMLYNGHGRNILLMLVLAATAFLGALAVSRYVQRRGDS